MENALKKTEDAESSKQPKKKAAKDLRVGKFRVCRSADAKYLKDALVQMLHVQNMLIILNKQDPSKDFLNPRIVRALAAGTPGGQLAEQIADLRKKYGQNEVFKGFLKTSKGLKEKNIYCLTKKLKVAYSVAAKKRAKGDLLARDPKARKLRDLSNFAISVDECAFSLKKKNLLGLNLSGKMRYFPIKHDLIKKACGSLEAVEALEVVLNHGEIFVHLIYKPDHICAKTAAASRKNAAIDLGVKNLVSLFVEDRTSQSLVISGQQPLSKNAQWNRKYAKLSSQKSLLVNKIEALDKDSLERKKVGEELSLVKKQISRLFNRRKAYFDDLVPKVSRRILEYSREQEVTHLYLSRNLTRCKKEGPKMGRKQNQKFMHIPYARIIDRLVLLGAEHGICVEDTVDEAYSSKSSCLSSDVCKVQELSASLREKAKRSEEEKALLTNAYKGKRVKRHLFEDSELSCKVLADLNAAANHVKLAIGKGRDMRWLKDYLWKLCSPVVVKCDSMFLDLHFRKAKSKEKRPEAHKSFYATWSLAHI